PTPAVCGAPRETARELIAALEGAARGLYAGAIGWVSADEAELAVTIRSALVAGNRATVFAGAGIVAGSDPDQEWNETELKMQPLLRALEG
ncbi:MAG: chorismate-binding protein, partial [bacterium]|nr:chorismate-binding protein [bacterium]